MVAGYKSKAVTSWILLTLRLVFPFQQASKRISAQSLHFPSVSCQYSPIITASICKGTGSSSVLRPQIYRLKSTSMEETSGTGMCDFDCNILHADLRKEKDRFIASAVDVGVRWFISPGSQLKDSRELLEMTKIDNRFFATAGVHPYNAESEPLTESSLQALEDMVVMSNCYAVGECGLDYSDTMV
jgi:TatD related DNase